MFLNVRLTMNGTFVPVVLLLETEWTGTVGIGTETNSTLNCLELSFAIIIYLRSESNIFKIYRESLFTYRGRSRLG